MKSLFRVSLLSAIVVALGLTTISAKPTGGASAAWLGVYTQSLDDELARGFNLSTSTGAIINQVVDDSPADEAGLRENDIVVSVNGAPVKTADELTDFIRDHKPGETVDIKVLRDGKEREFKVTLGDKESAGEPESWSSEEAYAPRAQVFKFLTTTSSDVYIGVQLTSLTDQLRSYFGVRGDNGVLVSSVEKETPAEKAGIKAGDVILQVDGKDCTDADDIIDRISNKEKGDKVEIALMRDRKPLSLNVELAEHETTGSSRRAMKTFTIPDVGRIPGHAMPKMKGLWYGTDDESKNSDDLREELKELQKQLQELKRQLSELKESRK